MNDALGKMYETDFGTCMDRAGVTCAVVESTTRRTASAGRPLGRFSSPRLILVILAPEHLALEVLCKLRIPSDQSRASRRVRPLPSPALPPERFV